MNLNENKRKARRKCEPDRDNNNNKINKEKRTSDVELQEDFYSCFFYISKTMISHLTLSGRLCLITMLTLSRCI